MHRALDPRLIAGLLLVGGAAAWHFGLAPRWTRRLPPGWTASSRYVGTMTYADDRTGQFPTRDVLSEYERTQRALSDSAPPQSVVLEDRLVIRDIATGKTTWDYVTRSVVDSRTGAHRSESSRGDVAVFPRNVQHTTYRLRANYVKGVPLSFERPDTLDGLRTYLFAYQGRGEYTESYAGSGEFAGIRPPPGEEIRCADDQFYYRAWIEPITGEQVKLEEGCPSGDYFFSVATAKPGAAVARWSGVTAGDALIERIAEVRAKRARYLWASRYIPGSMLLLGMTLLGLALRRVRVLTP